MCHKSAHHLSISAPTCDAQNHQNDEFFAVRRNNPRPDIAQSPVRISVVYA
jgi:hypothetical protein